MNSNKSIKPGLLLLFIFVGMSMATYSQSHLFSYEKFTDAEGKTLNYRKLVSDYDTTSKFPLVVFLHGMGERGDDNEAQLKWGVQNFASDFIMKTHRPIVIAPQCPDGMTWGSYNYSDMTLNEEPTEPMQLLIDLINETVERLPIDPDRIYITGLSMGGYGTYDIVMRNPALFAAAVPVCGAGDVTKAASIAHIPTWVFHGALDAAVPVHHSVNMVKALMAAGANPGYTQYPEAGHFSWIAAYTDEMMLTWLFSQKK